ncbi:response receiver-modulated cyclic diguanylate phosphodiesterase [Geotalea daltonii FRC-32]|uniref:Response receiver-modulated cyclic diguanylate phosphodiesterase n=1 Tax=Geotalea daltonii (strain DSM 22248 / JCM 15807 / FRC-32) TaxID=316067 RepID=B9M662_GEODF|nr:HD domain-containing phosphohydrolase [Geotalea daltonii]ACM21850.1 response receiver-modulated cyclic diguanylate phosphodiesterase [Geotalea daltonii FRC-32]
MVAQTTSTILVVDDEENILRAIVRLLMEENDINVLTAGSGSEGLSVLQAHPDVALILSDQRMPGMTGAEFLQQAKSLAPEAIRMVLTGYADINATMDAINKGGASCYITKPWDDGMLVQTLTEGVQRYRMTMENKRLSALVQQQNAELHEWNNGLKSRVMEQTTRIRQQMEELRLSGEIATRNWQNTILAFSSVIGLLDSLAKNHSNNVSAVAEESARKLQLTEDEIETIRVAALLHDIGKIGIEPGILRMRYELLDDEERAEYARHPVRGQAVVDVVEGLRSAGQIIRHHHELYDGTGFPDGLSGKDIPIGARIIAIADFVDTTISRMDASVSIESIMKSLKEKAESFFDPELLPTVQEVSTSYYIGLTDRSMVVQEISPKDLCTGMVLAREVISGTGLLLLNKGATLDEAKIHALKRYYSVDPPEGGVFVFVSQ